MADLDPRSFFPFSLSAHFNSMDRYRAHFADFQVHSSLNRSKKTSGLLLEKNAKRAIAPKKAVVPSF